MLQYLKCDGKTTAALLAAFLLLLVALFSHQDQEMYYNANFEKDLWLPGRETMASFAGGSPFPDDICGLGSESILAMEGDAGFQNTIRIPDSLAPTSPAEAESNPPKQNPALNSKFEHAVTLMKEGKLDEAEREWAEYVDADPDNAEGWRQLGDCRYNLNKVAEALGAYRLALRKDKDNYLAERGRGVASLYLGYDAWEKNKKKLAHDYFYSALTSLHTCLQNQTGDELARYGQALAAEGASRQLYVIALKALNGESAEQAKDVIRNCLDILDSAIGATEERLERTPTDTEARMLLGCLLIRRAKILQPFGHVEEATSNLRQAVRAFEPLASNAGRRSESAKGQVAICQNLLKDWSR